MKLSGKVSSDLPLLVLALAEEAQSLDTRLPVLLTGMGKVNAACALAGILGRDPLPARVVNLGTAGALRPGLSGIHPVDTVIQHDLDADVLRTLTGISVGGSITVAASGEGLTLATGDAFIESATDRNRLADPAHLVDMEGYALAAAASQAGVEIVKYVSDDTDESAEGSWRNSVAKAARSLADWAAQNLIVPDARSAVDASRNRLALLGKRMSGRCPSRSPTVL
jgi:adenosylhomocysteine nucleosidase